MSIAPELVVNSLANLYTHYLFKSFTLMEDIPYLDKYLGPLKFGCKSSFLFVCIMNERTNPSAKFSQVFRPYRPIFKILGDEKGMETENETKHSYLSLKTNKNVTKTI